MRPAVPSSRGRVRPGAGMWPTLIAAVAVLAYAGVSHAIWPQLIGCALVGMLASSFLGVRKAPQLGVAVGMPERVTVGDELDVVITLTNKSGRSCRALRIRHRLHSARRIAADGAGYVDRIAANSSAAIRRYARRRGINVTVPRKRNERRRGAVDRAAYRARNRVERIIGRCKQFRCLAARYEKRTENYCATWVIAAILRWL